MTALPYRRLPGKRRGVFEVVSLHLGPDHILQVRSTRLNEEYQRFYFQDVQSIALCETAPVHYVWTAVVLIVAVAVNYVSRDARWPLGILAAGSLFLWLRGASCDVRLQTGVTSERLKSLHRMKTARRVLPVIREQIESVQGRVTSVPDDYVISVAPQPPPLPSGSLTQALGARRYDHALFFGFLALEAVLLGAWLARPARALEQAIGIAALIEFLGLVIVLVRQAQQRIPKALRNMTYFSTARWFLVQGAGMILAYKAVLIDHAKATLDPLTFVRGTLTQVTLISILGTAAAGLWLSLRRDDE